MVEKNVKLEFILPLMYQFSVVLDFICIAILCTLQYCVQCIDNPLRTSGSQNGNEKRIIKSLIFFYSFFPLFIPALFIFSKLVFIFIISSFYSSLFLLSFSFHPFSFHFFLHRFLSFPFISLLSFLLFSSFQTNKLPAKMIGDFTFFQLLILVCPSKGVIVQAALVITRHDNR